MLARIDGSNELLHDRKLLVADDDAHNIFALAFLLENQGDTGTSRLRGPSPPNPPDRASCSWTSCCRMWGGGYRDNFIREDARLSTLPILPLTAKALVQAISKPVNTHTCCR